MKTNIQSNALRIKYAVILLSIIGCLVSCKSKESEPEQPVQINLKEKAEEVATYLTDNYNVGDSVFFLTETGETEGFVIKNNYFREIIDVAEPEWGDPDPEEVVIGYNMSTLMESEKDTFWIELFVNDPQTRYATVDGGIDINHKYIVDDFLTLNMAGDSITIVYPTYDKSCTLRKNVGLTRVQNNSSTWDLIQ